MNEDSCHQGAAASVLPDLRECFPRILNEEPDNHMGKLLYS